MNDILINYSADVLAQTKDGMTWTQIARFFRKKSVEYKVLVPYTNTIFPSQLSNRRVGFIENLRMFSSDQQLMLLTELCSLNKNMNINPLKKLLMIHCIKKGFMLDQIVSIDKRPYNIRVVKNDQDRETGKALPE